MAYKHVIRAKTKNLLSDISVQSPVGVSYDKQSGIFTINSNDKTSIGYSDSVMDFITPIPVGAVITVSIYCISGRYRATQGDNTAIGGYHKYTSSTDLNTWQGLVRLPSGTDLSGKTFTITWTVTKPLDAFWIYAPRHTDIIEEDIKFRAQLELGSTPTPYTPYNYLQSNKRMIKVSDVCQLYDKTYPVTQTVNGVTFTNNGDGSVTVNGTASNTASTEGEFLHANPGDKILMFSGYDIAALKTAFVYCSQWDENKHWIADLGYPSLLGRISTCNKNCRYIRYTYRVDRGNTATNAVIKLQIFNLTEMFGAGHEPATVAEFRQRFPNEYYPYSPQCWLTSYKSAVVCKTKNLFDVNNAVPYTFSTDNPDGNLIWLKDGIYTTRMNNYNIGSGLRIKNGLSLPAGTYTVSAKIVDFNNVEKFVIGFRYKTTDGTWKVSSYPYENYKVGNRIALRVILPENTDVRLYLTYQNNNGVYLTGFVSYKDIQLEQGSTETSYVPYQHL